MSISHSASDIAGIIFEVIRDRIGSPKPSYLGTDSAPANKAAVHIFMGDSGDESLFPCAVHFVQLAMREAVQDYLNGSKESLRSEDIIHDSNNVEYPVQQLKIRECTTTFWRLISTCRATRTIIKRKILVCPSFR